MSGRTKGVTTSGVRVPVPVSGLTSHSKIPAGKWAKRYVEACVEAGQDEGFLFSKPDGSRAPLGYFEDDFYELLEEVQKTTRLIEQDVDIHAIYGIWRSLRRGASAHATNRMISNRLIHLVHRWRHEEEKHARFSGMLDIYTSLVDLIPTTVKYSHSF